MPYGDFTLKQATRSLGISIAQADLFGAVPPVEAPGWLLETLGRRTLLATSNEKSRSEFIVVPILQASQELSPTPLAIFSGERLDVDPSRGLVGECDFILAGTLPVPPLRAPIAVIVEAKENDIESGLGQCLAQMVAAALFNQADGRSGPIHGCVTSGEVWQFLQLVGSVAILDRRRYYLDDLEGIMAALQAVISLSAPKPDRVEVFPD